MSQDVPRPGEQIGPFVVERELGRGGVGVVLAARHATLGKPVALKVLLGRVDPRKAERFKREASSGARVEHPGVVQTVDVGVDPGGRRWLAMELVPGVSLRARIERDGPLPFDEVRRIGREVADALHAAHSRGLVHRDVKPDNVLLDPRGAPPGRPRARLTDFGLARLLADDEAARLTRTGEIVGTPAYMPPEQVAGKTGALDGRADVYSLGATLFEALTGHPPFEGDSMLEMIAAVLGVQPPRPSALRPDVPAALEAALLRCLEKDPAARFATAAELAQALAPEATAPDVAADAGSRAPLAAVVIAGALLVLVLALAPGSAPPSPSSSSSSPSSSSSSPPSPSSPSPSPSPSPSLAIATPPASLELPAPIESRDPTPPVKAPGARPRDWRLRATATGPSPRFGLEGGLAWDAGRGALLLYGGCTAGGEPLGDTWALDGSGWTNLGEDLGPGPRYGHGLVRDFSRDCAVVISGATGSTSVADQRIWEWKGRRWQVATGSDLGQAPVPRSGGAYAGAVGRRVVFLFGGAGPDDPLWEWSGARGSWRALRSPVAPPGRSSAALVWVPSRRALVLFGGKSRKSGPLGDTWEWSESRGWVEQAIPGPPARDGHGLVWDGQRVILFGGRGAASALDDTWAWNGEAWEQLAYDSRPTPRARFGMGWDPTRKAIVVFGGVAPGRGGLEVHQDTWELGF